MQELISRRHKSLNICFWMIVSQNKKINVMVKYLKKETKNSKDLEIILKNRRCRKNKRDKF
jgi:hypothetical protein